VIVKAKSNVNKREKDEFIHMFITPLKDYPVIEIGADSYRVIDDSACPYLYPKYLFTIVDPVVPNDWIKEEDQDGEYWIGPFELSRSGFYEDYFDQNAEAITLFKKVYSRYYPD